MTLPIGTRLGPHEITGSLGAGAMGEVYRARDTKLKREVALKFLPDRFASDPERLVRFQREAEALASLNHPNIAAIYGLEESRDVRALVLELVEGPTLEDFIARGPVPLEEALTVAMQIAQALEAAHARGIVHRDLKPANIKRTPDGQVKVLDFGLAKVSAGSAAFVPSELATTPGDDISSNGAILGTVAYMSPEQARGLPADPRSDVWAFGCVLYEMLAGRRAFAGAAPADTMGTILRSEPDWDALPAETPALIRRLLRRALTKEPAERLHSVADARLDIADARNPSRRPAPRRTRRPRCESDGGP